MNKSTIVFVILLIAFLIVASFYGINLIRKKQKQKKYRINIDDINIDDNDI